MSIPGQLANRLEQLRSIMDAASPDPSLTTTEDYIHLDSPSPDVQLERGADSYSVSILGGLLVEGDNVIPHMQFGPNPSDPGELVVLEGNMGRPENPVLAERLGQFGGFVAALALDLLREATA